MTSRKRNVCPCGGYIWAAVVFILGEMIRLIVFSTLKKRLGPEKNSPASKGATARGILERVVLVTGLLHDFPQIIIAFGALKLGTRLHEEKESDISNAYFLVGNLISILLAMIICDYHQGPLGNVIRSSADHLRPPIPQKGDRDL